MPLPPLQDLIHRFEQGGGMRPVRIALAVFAVLLLMVGYDIRAFRNMSHPEAMDAAQLARNISTGKGYVTQFVRPFSIHLLTEKNKASGPRQGKETNLAQLKGDHPDLQNPPLYPVLLAGWMKILPFDYIVTNSKQFWSFQKQFWRYQPDFLIALLNQAIFLITVGMVFYLARRLFDTTVAVTSAFVLLGTELLWRFSVSGLSTMLQMLLFVSLAWIVVLFEQESREPKRGPMALLGFAALLGMLVGAGALTRYAFAAILLPVVAFILLFGGQKRILLALVCLVTFFSVVSPWLARNYSVSGTLLGTAGHALVEDTFLFPDFKLQRSLDPDLSNSVLTVFWHKLTTNTRVILQDHFITIGRTWLTSLFMVGIMVGFVNPATRRLRYFALLTIPVLIITQALTQTALTKQSPEVNSENLLILLTPLIIVYGTGLFFMLLDQIALPMLQARYAVIAAFVVLATLPITFVLIGPRGQPVAFPPYYPPAIQILSSWLKEEEMVMTDIPWAVAWYGDRQSIWLTQRVEPDPKTLPKREDFFAVNDFLKPVNILYLSPETMDRKFISDWAQGEEKSWGALVIQTVVQKEVPDTFPLRKSLPGWLPQQLLLTDWERWRAPQ